MCEQEVNNKNVFVFEEPFMRYIKICLISFLFQLHVDLAFICCVHKNWMFVINVGASSHWSIPASSKYSTINLDAYQQPHWIVDLRVFFCYCLLNGCFCFPTALFFDVLRGLEKKTFSLTRSCHLSMLYPQAYATIAIYRFEQVEQ